MSGGGPGDLWSFALRIYGSPGVETACLALQDRHGLDVNLILLACWLGARGVPLDPARLADLDRAVVPWRDEVIRPLRNVRRALKTPDLGPLQSDSGAAGDAGSIRAKVKQLELSAERMELRMLEAASSGWPVAAEPGAPIIALNLGHLHDFGGQDRPALDTLVAAAA